MRNTWSDLFILGLVQCSSAINLADILGKVTNHLQFSVDHRTISGQRVRMVTTTICKIQEYINAMTKLSMDEKEFALLKLLAVFNSGIFEQLLNIQ